VLCLVLVCWPRRRRRVETDPESPYPDATSRTGGTTTPSWLDDPWPVLGSPVRSSGTRPPWYIVVGVSLLAGGVASAVVAPTAGIPVALATLLAVVSPYGRVLLALGSVGLLVVVDQMVTAAQDKFHYAAEFGWPTHFETASTLAWLAVAALAADALVQEVRERRGRRVGAAVAEKGHVVSRWGRRRTKEPRDM
jgi:hypothetical protein